jgi:alanine racemase
MTTATAGPAAAEQQRARASAARAALEVDLVAVRHNVEVIRRAAGGARVMAVVKGDAYGLGATVIARALETWGVPALAVDNVAEGVELRAGGISIPIMIIDGDVSDNATLAVEHDLAPGIAHERLLAAYDDAARRRGGKHSIWLASNVGFNRAGYRDPEKFARFAARASECRHLEVRGIYAHLTNSNSDADLTLSQIEEFKRQAERARQVLGTGLETSLFASHGLVRWARAFPTDWVRPGILLYGEHDFAGEELEPEAADLLRQFRPVVSLRARVIHLLEFSGAEGVGYGQQYRTRPGQRLATVAVGFGGGYPSPPGRAYALAGGRRAAVFGKVGMDALQIDVTDAPGLALDDWATLIGCDGAERISVRELARAAGTSPYELMRRLRCHRTYINAENISP